MSNDGLTGLLFVFAAPSGAGKSSLVNALLETDPLLHLSVSDTTRPARPGEQEGVHYHFVTPEEFSASLEAGEYLEHALVFDHRYGTRLGRVQAALARGVDVLLEIDWQGARQVRAQFDDACLIFILPPSIEALRERLQHRGQDSAETIARRMHSAREEMAHYGEFDYVVVNDEFDETLSKLRGIVSSERLRTRRQEQRQRRLLDELLNS